MIKFKNLSFKSFTLSAPSYLLAEVISPVETTAASLLARVQGDDTDREEQMIFHPPHFGSGLIILRSLLNWETVSRSQQGKHNVTTSSVVRFSEKLSQIGSEILEFSAQCHISTLVKFPNIKIKQEWGVWWFTASISCWQNHFQSVYLSMHVQGLFIDL